MVNVNEIIDNLSTKFGVTSQYLITEISRYKIARSISFAVIFGLLEIICIAGIILVRRKWKKDEAEYYKEKVGNSDKWYYSSFDDEDYKMYIGFVTAASIVFLFAVIFNIATAIGYVVSPVGAVTDMVLRIIQ